MQHAVWFLLLLCAAPALAEPPVHQIVVAVRRPHAAAFEAYLRRFPTVVGGERWVGTVESGGDRVFLVEILEERINEHHRHATSGGHGDLFVYDYLLESGVQVPEPAAITEATLDEGARLLSTGNFLQQVSLLAVYQRLTLSTRPDAMARLSVPARDRFAAQIASLIGSLSRLVRLWEDSALDRSQPLSSAAAMRANEPYFQLVLAASQVLHRLATPFGQESLVFLADATRGTPLQVMGRDEPSRELYLDLWYRLATAELSRAPTGIGFVVFPGRYVYSPVPRPVLTPLGEVNTSPSLMDVSPLASNFLIYDDSRRLHAERFAFFIREAERILNQPGSGYQTAFHPLVDSVLNVASRFGRFRRFPYEQQRAFALSAAYALRMLLDDVVTEHLRAFLIDRSARFLEEIASEGGDRRIATDAALTRARRELYQGILRNVPRVPAEFQFPCKRWVALVGELPGS